MTFKIGFHLKNTKDPETRISNDTHLQEKPSVASIVNVFFPEKNHAYPYYNDRFDLKIGDTVYVEGKLEGFRGIVKNINYNFKIKLSDYKKVIAATDNKIYGELFFGNSHMLAFDPQVIPKEKVALWFNAPSKEETVYGYDNSYFHLDKIEEMEIDREKAARGHQYYIENRVCYISLQENKGYAIVSGTKPYEVEFLYDDGKISALTCDCFCGDNCKHEFAAMLQLKEILDTIENRYSDRFETSRYFAALSKEEWIRNTLFHQNSGSILFR